jgi:SH3-like domain-containing protein
VDARSNLSTERTAYVSADEDVRLQADPRDSARTVATLAPGVVARLTGCRGDWRRLTVSGRVGWVRAETLWGGDDCAGL